RPAGLFRLLARTRQPRPMMENNESIVRIDDKKSHWTVKAPSKQQEHPQLLQTNPTTCCLKGTLMPRELIETGTDKRYVRRDERGQFSESDDVGRSHASDQKREAKNKAKRGEGDRGDR